MVACFIFNYRNYPVNIFKLIIKAQFGIKQYEFIEENNQLIIFILNIKWQEVANLIDQFNNDELQVTYGYGIGRTKEIAKKEANVNLLFNPSKIR